MQEPTETIASSFAPDPSEAAEVVDGTETERTVDVKLSGGRACSVSYDLGEITPRVRKSISSMADADEDKAEGAMIDLLDKIVTKWDYVTRKGKSIAPTADQIAENVSLRDLSAIVSGIFQGTQSGNG
jgi:hypothetical protein